MSQRLLATLTLALTLFGASVTAAAGVRGHDVTYSDGETTFKGYIAYDDALSGPRPGVLVVHEWWGHNEHARASARRLAEQGYLALAVDMYGEGKTAEHPKDAGAFASAVGGNPALARKRFEAALKYLQERRIVDTERIAAIGYCFGGTVVLNMARAGLPLQGVVSFHGSLATKTPAEANRVKARVAVFTGADDPMIPPAQIEAFQNEMRAAGVDHRLVSYPGVKHAFTNLDADRLGQTFGLPLAYDAQADRDSWADAVNFLKDVLAKP
jgi:dienelactone hydrolase